MASGGRKRCPLGRKFCVRGELHWHLLSSFVSVSTSTTRTRFVFSVTGSRGAGGLSCLPALPSARDPREGPAAGNGTAGVSSDRGQSGRTNHAGDAGRTDWCQRFSSTANLQEHHGYLAES